MFWAKSRWANPPNILNFQLTELRQRVMILVAHINDAIVQIRRGPSTQQQSDNVQWAFLVISHQVSALRRVQVSSRVLEASSPHGRVEEQQATGTRIIREEENVALDEDLEVLELVELENAELKIE